MKTAWIMLFLLNGCFEMSATTTAFKTEIECQKELQKRQKQLTWYQSGQGNCVSVDALLADK